LGFLASLLNYVRLEEDDWYVYVRSPDDWVSKPVDAEALMDYLKTLPYVSSVTRRGRWVVATLTGRVKHYIDELRDELRKRFGVPVSVFGKREVGIPVEVKPKYVEVGFGVFDPETYDLARKAGPLCIVVSGTGTYDVRGDLKEMSYTFDRLRGWVKCFGSVDEVYSAIDDLIEKLSDKVPVKVRKDLNESVEHRLRMWRKIAEERASELSALLETLNRYVGKVLERLSGPAREFVESREWKVIARDGEICFKPKKFLGDKFREIRQSFREAGGDWNRNLSAFCLRIAEKRVGREMTIDPEQIEKLLNIYSRYIEKE